MNAIVRDAVRLGLSPEDAIVLGSLNPARWHGLDRLGAVAPGYQADLLVLPDLETFVPDVVLKAGGRLGEILGPTCRTGFARPSGCRRSARTSSGSPGTRPTTPPPA